MTKILHYITIAFPLAIFVALSTSLCAIAQQEGTGALQGRLVYPDNSGVENAQVKIVDKLDVYKANVSSNYLSVQQIGIARDALVEEVITDRNGRFLFSKLPPGKYYLFFKVTEAYEGDDWIYQYHKPWNILYLAGYMPKPDEHTVKPGEVATVTDIEIIKKLEATLPSKLADKDGFYRFTWSKHEIESFFRLTLEHQDYHGQLQHPAYRTQQIEQPSHTNSESLLPGRHRFRVEQMVGKTLRVYAKSPWVEFTVPGEVLKLAFIKDDHDPTGRTISWRGSDAIKTVRIVSKDVGYDTLITNKTVQLPVAPGKKFELRPCDEKGKELIPGWLLFYWQPQSKDGK